MPPTTLTELRDALAQTSDLRVVRRIIAAAPCAILIADRSSRYVVVNRAACQLTGYRESELLRMGVSDLTGPVDLDVSDVLWRAFLEQGLQRGEYTLSRKDGSTVLVQYAAMANVSPGLHASFLTAAPDAAVADSVTDASR